MKVYVVLVAIVFLNFVNSATDDKIRYNGRKSATSDDQLIKIRFLIKNRAMCGRLFKDPLWSPVIYKCDVFCKENEVCVENDDLQQGCAKLPTACASAWLKRRGRSPRSTLRSNWVQVRSKLGPRQRTMLISNF
ncbi:unnamed protein product [Bursaphelenchus okinawaensis]|uniref:Uncharacterized protein n=1 Tax=Bursaphelenchus okinawaensis TaxID=465554 RepID=A0A811KNT3_9BILA|nr:unnamed protein product [Bursaphelenchus okinawaensis]CAG9106081.1 unnamed protein product [Bursaphelenchus okinawaensis]